MHKVRYLDGLRGIAALVVVLDHFAIAFFQRATDASIHLKHTNAEDVILQTPLHLLISGNFAVAIFFVLSGFVLSARFFRQGGGRRAVLVSAYRRYPRLVLPVLASVVASFILLTFGLFHNQAAAAITGSTWLNGLWNGATPSFFDALYHATIGVFIDGFSQYNTVLWTMQAELVGSFLVFGLLLTIGQWRYRWFVYGVLALLLLNSFLLCFVAGVALCDWYTRRSAAPAMPSRLWLPLLAGSLVLGSVPVGTLAGTAFSWLPSWLGYGMNIPYRLHMVGAIGLVVVLVATPSVQKIFASRAAVYLGRVSFGLYLTHLLVVGTVSCWLFTAVEPVIGYLPGFAVMFIVSMAVIAAVAHGFSHWVDEPAIRFSALVSRMRWRGWRPKPSGAAVDATA